MGRESCAWLISDWMVGAPSIVSCSGSPGMNQKCEQAFISSKAARPSCPMGSAAEPSKQTTPLACVSCMTNANSRCFHRMLTGTATAPVFRIPKNAMANSIRFEHARITRSPGTIPAAANPLASRPAARCKRS